jgi:hypothetical protein
MTPAADHFSPVLFRPEARQTCASTGCDRLVGDDPWEESAQHCWHCSLERDLWDREARWDRIPAAAGR